MSVLQLPVYLSGVHQLSGVPFINSAISMNGVYPVHHLRGPMMDRIVDSLKINKTNELSPSVYCLPSKLQKRRKREIGGCSAAAGESFVRKGRHGGHPKCRSNDRPLQCRSGCLERRAAFRQIGPLCLEWAALHRAPYRLQTLRRYTGRQTCSGSIRMKPRVGFGNALFLSDLATGTPDATMRAKLKAGEYPDIHRPSIKAWRTLAGRIK